MVAAVTNALNNSSSVESTERTASKILLLHHVDLQYQAWAVHEFIKALKDAQLLDCMNLSNIFLRVRFSTIYSTMILDYVECVMGCVSHEEQI